jgi:hypothetical protein
VFILLEFPSPSRRIFIGSHSLPPPSLVRRIGPSTPQSARGPPAPSVPPRASPAAPGAGAGTPHGTRRRPSPGAPCRCRGEAGLGVAEVEPSSLPIRVVDGHCAGDVLLLALGPRGERQAADARHAAGPRLRRRQRMQLGAEEMDPEIPIHKDPQEALADADERGRLRNCVQREVMKLHAVVLAEGPHEAARRLREAALVKAYEADNVAVQRIGHSLPLRRHDPLSRPPILVCRQLAAGHQLTQGQQRRRRALPRRRVDDDERLLGSHASGRGSGELEARRALRAEAQWREWLRG